MSPIWTPRPHVSLLKEVHADGHIPVIRGALHGFNHVFLTASPRLLRVGVRGGCVRGSEPRFDVGPVDDAGVAVVVGVDGAGSGCAGVGAGVGGDVKGIEGDLATGTRFSTGHKYPSVRLLAQAGPG